MARNLVIVAALSSSSWPRVETSLVSAARLTHLSICHMHTCALAPSLTLSTPAPPASPPRYPASFVLTDLLASLP